MTGLFIALDGPSGVGKSTVSRLLAAHLTAAGRRTVLTRQPSDGPLGTLARLGTHDYRGHALACLIAADRYHQQHHTIRPALAAGSTVISDRSVASTLVLQTADGVPADLLWQLNAHVDPPDLTIILTGDSQLCRQRARARGLYSRFHDTTADTPDRYRDVATHLERAGHRTVVHDIGSDSADQVADTLTGIVLRLAGQFAARDTT